jgi:cell division protein ZapA
VDPKKSVVTVEIAGQRYPISSGLEPAYVVELAAYVDRKMRTAAEAAPSTDTLGLAVLVALNLADEYFRARQFETSSEGQFTERALRLERLVDEVLGSRDNLRVGSLGI